MEIPFGIHVDNIFYFISVKKFGTLDYVVDVSSHRNVSVTSEDFKFISQRKVKPFRCRANDCRMFRVVALDSVVVEVQRGLEF